MSDVSLCTSTIAADAHVYVTSRSGTLLDWYSCNADTSAINVYQCFMPERLKHCARIDRILYYIQNTTTYVYIRPGTHIMHIATIDVYM